MPETRQPAAMHKPMLVLRLIQIIQQASELVMPGLDPGIHASATDAAVRGKDVDGRDKPDHDDDVNHMIGSEH